MLDLDYPEDSQAETDMNVVMTADGRLVEVQATAEREPFTRDELDALLDLAAGGIEELAIAQRARRRRAAGVRARLASGNPHKLVELRRALAGVGDRADRRPGVPTGDRIDLRGQRARQGRARPPRRAHATRG